MPFGTTKNRFDSYFVGLPTKIEMSVLDLLDSSLGKTETDIVASVPYCNDSVVGRLVEKGFVSVHSEKNERDFVVQLYRTTPKGKQLLQAWAELQPFLRKVAKIYSGKR